MISTKQLLANPGTPALVAWVTDPHSNPLPPPLSFYTIDGVEFYVDFVKGTYWFEGEDNERISERMFQHTQQRGTRVRGSVDLHKYVDSQYKESIFLDLRTITTHAAVDGRYLVVGNRVLIPRPNKPSKIRYITEHDYANLLIPNLKQHIRKLLIRHLKEAKHPDRGIAIDEHLFIGKYRSRIERLYTEVPAEMSTALDELAKIYSPNESVLTRREVRELKSQAAELDRSS